MGPGRRLLTGATAELAGARAPRNRWKHATHLCALVLLGPMLPYASLAQNAAPTSSPTDELPPEVRAALQDVADGTLTLDGPAFRLLVAHVRNSRHAPGHTQPPVVIDDWRALAERPNAYRGVPVTIEGRVGRNKDPYTLPRYPELGILTQLELFQAGQPLSCTVIVTGDVDDVPVGATVRVTGYFLLLRLYLDRDERPHHAALLIAPGITSIAAPAPAAAGGSRQAWLLLGALALGLVIAWILLRRAAHPPRRSVTDLHASRPARLNLAQDLAEWAEGGDNPGAAAAGRASDERP